MLMTLHRVCLFSGIHGGYLLGVRSVSGLAFYDWESTELVRRIEISPKHVPLTLCHIPCLRICVDDVTAVF